MTKIAVVDDDEIFANDVAKVIRDDFAQKKLATEVKCFHGSRIMFGLLDDHQNFDVYFLDVEMGDQSGVELAKKIRSVDANAVIIFLTSHEKYAIEGYSCRAFEYITKERWRKRLPEILTQLQKKLRERGKRIYRIQNERKYEVINWDDIYYIEKQGKNAIFNCKDDKIYMQRIALEKVYALLPESEFVYINRGQIINLAHVTHLDAEIVKLNDVISLYLSRYLLGNVRRKLTEFWRVL